VSGFETLALFLLAPQSGARIRSIVAFPVSLSFLFAGFGGLLTV